jgi:predicted amidohydrolase
MPVELTLALAQLENTVDPARNLEKASQFARQAASLDADVLVLPEMFMALAEPDTPLVKIVRKDQGAFVEGLKSLAVETGLTITCGCWEASDSNEHVYNTTYTLSSDGNILAAYRKLHLFDALSMRESDLVMRGDELPPVIEIAGVRVGFATCYDLRFPEMFRYLSGQGAQLIIMPSAWYQGSMKETHWLTLLAARALENTLYMAGCNLIGPGFCGRSALFDPFGVQLANAGEAETLLIGKISTDRIDSVRQKLPCLQNRRSDLFPA